MLNRRTFYAMSVLALFVLVMSLVASADDEADIVLDEAYSKRKLSAHEEAEIRRISDEMIDKMLGEDRPDPVEMAEKYGHVQLLPAILALVRDESEDPEMRRRAAYALDNIADRRAVDEMVELVMDKDPDIARNTADSLITLSGIGIGRGISIWDRNGEGRKKVYRDWKNWWKRNRETATLNWDEKFSVPVHKRLPTPEDVAP